MIRITIQYIAEGMDGDFCDIHSNRRVSEWLNYLYDLDDLWNERIAQVLEIRGKSVSSSNINAFKSSFIEHSRYLHDIDIDLFNQKIHE